MYYQFFLTLNGTAAKVAVEGAEPSSSGIAGLVRDIIHSDTHEVALSNFG